MFRHVFQDLNRPGFMSKQVEVMRQLTEMQERVIICLVKKYFKFTCLTDKKVAFVI